MKLSSCLKYIKSDLYRYQGKTSFKSFLFCYWYEIGFRFMFWLRLANCSTLVINIPARIYLNHLRHKYGICILRTTKIGYGFKIKHGGPCVINAGAVIGNNVDIYQYSTIGSSHMTPAHIGDNVYIGPSVCIVEDVKIGSGATIGAGAVVLHDVPAGATVGGVPAKVISHKEPGRLLSSIWHDKR